VRPARATLAVTCEREMNGALNRGKALEENAEDQPNIVLGMV
jgi:hypothetical protein